MFTLVAGRIDCRNVLCCCRELEICLFLLQCTVPVAGCSRFVASLNGPLAPCHYAKFELAYLQYYFELPELLICLTQICFKIQNRNKLQVIRKSWRNLRRCPLVKICFALLSPKSSFGQTDLLENLT